MTKDTSGKPTGKSTKVKTFFSFAIDIAIVAALVCFFWNRQNCDSFWRGVTNVFSLTIITVSSNITPHPKTSIQTPIAGNGRHTVSPQPQDSTRKTIATEPADPLPPIFSDFPEPPEIAGEPAAPLITRLFFRPPPLGDQHKVRKGKGKPIKFEKKKLHGVPFYQATIDLNDPDTYLVIRLPNKATQANSAGFTAGHENFDSFVKRYPSALMLNGTFFSKDEQERVMGNMISDGKILKYSQWENYGTTLALREGDRPEMITARADGKPVWSDHWFSLTCGPRLVRQGEIWLNPELEGFKDSHVLGVGPRSAIGFPKSGDKLYFIVFLQGLALKDEAELMQAIGCHEAMNIDGGASKALSHNSTVVMKPGRALTNVLVVYDCGHKAPPEVASAWRRFQGGEREEPVRQ